MSRLASYHLPTVSADYHIIIANGIACFAPSVPYLPCSCPCTSPTYRISQNDHHGHNISYHIISYISSQVLKYPHAIPCRPIPSHLSHRKYARNFPNPPGGHMSLSLPSFLCVLSVSVMIIKEASSASHLPRPSFLPSFVSIVTSSRLAMLLFYLT
ncbi:hypothetical protein B0H34DRAFT_98454 [Crassisporium funariophilum]|nr:hypothetical protein B0H34DRAFT_98454 [Crassisporium funariophilum]